MISGLSYGPNDPVWRDNLIRWAAAFPHIARHSLRGEAPTEAVTRVLDADAVQD